MATRNTYEGPALFSYGFRPFFLAATVFATGVVPLWWLVWRGDVTLRSVLPPADWHIHEMIFGYGAAVVAGFLFTAVPNWTGRLPTRGWPLAALLAVWALGRLAVAGLVGLGPVPVLLVDQTFLLAVALMISREIAAGKNWRNLKVLVPVSLLWLTNIGFHLEAMTQGSAEHGRRAGIALLIFLIMLIGGRIVPSFTRNWLAQREGARLPVPFNRFDGMAILVGAAALLAWVLAPASLACAGLSMAAALMQALRLARWGGFGTWRSPLLLMLHVAYTLVPLGFIGVAAAAFGLANPAVGAHIFGIGAVGCMTAAVMMRATMGHTGRELVAGRALTLAFALLVFATLARVAGEAIPSFGDDGIDLSALIWTGAFALLGWRLGPWLVWPKAGRKLPSAPAR